MSDTPQLLLAHHLKALKLPTFLREYDKLARQCAAEVVDHSGYLLRLAELELIDRERRTVERRIKEARFPTVKSLDSFDFAAIPSLNKALVLELARCEYIARRENVIAVGNSGTGKTHIALGLGLTACQKGLSVGFTTAAAMVTFRSNRSISEGFPNASESFPEHGCDHSAAKISCGSAFGRRICGQSLSWMKRSSPRLILTWGCTAIRPLSGLWRCGTCSTVPQPGGGRRSMTPSGSSAWNITCLMTRILSSVTARAMSGF